MNTVKKHAQHGFSQFELTTKIVKNLNKYDITPTAKLVLILLTTHFNEEKNGAVVFPSMPYISETLGISLTATKQAIKDLVSEGLILQSKREKIRGNYNKYILTQKVHNSTVEQAENESFKRAESDLSFIGTNKKNEIKEQNKEGGENVYKGDDLILYEYAKKKAKYNVYSFVKAIKERGGDKKIISDYKKQEKVTQMALRSVQETQELIRNYNEYSINSSSPYECEAWKKFGDKFKSSISRF